MYQSLNWRHTYMKKGDPKNQLRSDSRMQNALPFTKIYDNRSVSSSSHMQNSNIDTVQDFLIKLGIKSCLHILNISIFSLNRVTVRPNKIINNLMKVCKICTFKVIFQHQKSTRFFFL